jgi:hypothetical protein
MSEVNDLSEVVSDGVLSEPYTIQRSTGQFQPGGWVTTSINIPGYGIVSVASDEELLMVPEGDRVTGAMVFHSQKRIYETQLDGGAGDSTYGETGFGISQQRVSDIMIWNFHQWRVLHVYPYPNRRYWKAIATRLGGV